MPAISSLILIAIDQQNNVLASFNGGANKIPPLYPGEQKAFRVQVVNPSTSGFSGAPTWAAAVMSGLTLDISFGLAPLGNGEIVPVAATTGLTWDSGNQWYLGILDLSPSPVAALISGKPSADVVVEFRFWNGTVPVLTFQTKTTLLAVLDGGSLTTPPLPAPSYPTTSQADARYVSWTVPAGFVITFNTSDPKKQLLLSVNDNLETIWTPVITP